MLAGLLCASALTGLALTAEHASAQTASSADPFLRPVLDGDPRNPPRFGPRPPRSGEAARFDTLQNYRYRAAQGAGTTGFDSTGAPRKTKAGTKGKPASTTKTPTTD